MHPSSWLLFPAAAIGLLALTHGALHGSRKTLNTIMGGAVDFVACLPNGHALARKRQLSS